MAVNLDEVLAITVSGVRSEEETAVKQLIAENNLPVEDITTEKLKYFLALRKGNQILGVVGLAVANENALLRSLVVAKAFRGKGFAQKLLKAVQKFALTIGVHRLYLLTSTAETYFKRHGFEEIDRQAVPSTIQDTQEFLKLCSDEAVCLRKRITMQQNTA